MARMQRQLNERGQPMPPSAALQQLLERLIAERAQLRHARDMGLKIDDAVLTQAELSIARQNQLQTVEQLYQRIQSEGIAVKDGDGRVQVLLDIRASAKTICFEGHRCRHRCLHPRTDSACAPAAWT